MFVLTLFSMCCRDDVAKTNYDCSDHVVFTIISYNYGQLYSSEQ